MGKEKFFTVVSKESNRQILIASFTFTTKKKNILGEELKAKERILQCLCIVL